MIDPSKLWRIEAYWKIVEVFYGPELVAEYSLSTH